MKRRIFLIAEIVGLAFITIATLSFCHDALILSHSNATPTYAKWEMFTKGSNFFGNCIIILYGVFTLSISKIIENITDIAS